MGGKASVAKGKTRNQLLARSSSREVRIRVPTFFSVVYLSRGTLPKKTGGEPSPQKGNRALLGDLAKLWVQDGPARK